MDMRLDPVCCVQICDLWWGIFRSLVKGYGDCEIRNKRAHIRMVIGALWLAGHLRTRQEQQHENK